MPGSLGHLASRLVDYLFARPLNSHEVRTIEDWLAPEELALFHAQSNKDQAHGFHAGSVVAQARPERDDLIRAALLHDVAKRHARFGVVGRTLASLAIKFKLPLTKRMEIYRDHGPIGADEIEEAGSPQIAVDFARSHHGTRPPTITLEDWALLAMADEPPKPMVRRSRG